MEKIFTLIVILREELVSIAVLAFLLSYCFRTQRTSRDNSFIRICMFALLHAFLDALALITVNNSAFVPALVNGILQKLLYISAIMCINEIFTYVHAIAFFKKKTKNVRIASYVLVGLAALFIILFKGSYNNVNGIIYGGGIPLMVSYGVGIFYQISTILLLIIKYREVGESFCRIMIPVELLLCAVTVLQLFHPEIRATAGVAAIVMVGMFLALENPVDIYRQQAYMDMYTGVRNKNCYREDQKRLKNEKKKVGVVLFDLNNLKYVNDKFGHLSGDDFISTAARIIKDSMKDAWRIYRIGGDEFCAIYIDPESSSVLRERTDLQDECARTGTFKDYPFGMADGYAEGFIYNSSYDEIVSRADEDLYRNKRLMKEIDKYEFQ